MSCWVPEPAAMEAVDGERAMLVRVGLDTVRELVPLTDPEVAVMVVVPDATPVARPLAAMVAVAGLLLDQVTVEVQFDVVLLERVQVAVYCCVPVPAAMDAAAGEIAMLLTVGPVTVRALLPWTLPEVAEIVEVPAATPVASPALLMVAAAGFPLDQVTVEVQFEVAPVDEVQVAVYC